MERELSPLNKVIQAGFYVFVAASLYIVPQHFFAMDHLSRLSNRQMDAFEKGDFRAARSLGEEIHSALTAKPEPREP